MPDPSPSATLSGKAVLSMMLGLLSLPLCLVAGVPALIVGLGALREVHGSDGRLRGRRLAAAGMVLGGLGSLVWVLGTVAVVAQAVRATARGEECRHHLRSLNAALFVYHEKYGTFPTGTVPIAGMPPERRLSWYVLLLPMPPLNREELSKRFDLAQPLDAEPNRAAAATLIRSFWCPGAPPEIQPGELPRTDYVGIAGLGTDAPRLPLDHARAGVFGYDRATPVAAITRGTSHTFLVTETSWENGPWAAGGPGTVRPVVAEHRPHLGTGRPFGGLHGAGANVLFADGSVQFVTAAMKPDLFEAQSTIHEETVP